MSLMFLQEIEQAEPQIFVYPAGFADQLGDYPEKHRWRAQWEDSFGDRRIAGIALTAHPVVRRTPCGAWIDPFAYSQATHQPWEEGSPANEWVTTADRRLWKWVSDDGGQAWAKPTREDAIRSIAIRLTRWATKLRNDNEKLTEAAAALRTLRPDLARFADQASTTIGDQS